MGWITNKKGKPCERCGHRAPRGQRYCERCVGRIRAAMRKDGYLTPGPREVRTIADAPQRRRAAEGEING